MTGTFSLSGDSTEVDDLPVENSPWRPCLSNRGIISFGSLLKVCRDQWLHALHLLKRLAEVEANGAKMMMITMMATMINNDNH